MEETSTGTPTTMLTLLTTKTGTQEYGGSSTEELEPSDHTPEEAGLSPTSEEEDSLSINTFKLENILVRLTKELLTSQENIETLEIPLAHALESMVTTTDT